MQITGAFGTLAWFALSSASQSLKKHNTFFFLGDVYLVLVVITLLELNFCAWVLKYQYSFLMGYLAVTFPLFLFIACWC